MAENNNSNPPNNQHAEDQHDGKENAQQALDDLTVLQNVQNQNMGDARLNVARSVDVSDTQLGNLANVQQGSTGSPQVQNLGGIAGGVNVAIDVEIETAKDNTVAPPELESLGVDVRDEVATIAVNAGGAKALNVQELPDLAKPDAEFKPQDPALGQPVTLAPPGGFVANTQLQEGAAAPAAAEAAKEDKAPEIQAAVNHAPTVAGDASSSTVQEGTVSGRIVASDNDGDALTFQLIGADGQPTNTITNDHGTITINPSTGEYTFVASEATRSLGLKADGSRESVTDLFQIRVSDSHGGDVSTNLSVTVEGLNDGPTVSGAVTLDAIDEDKSITMSAADWQAKLLGKASDIDGDDLSVSLSGFQVSNGKITDNQDGTFTFTPGKDFNGDIEATYTVSDGHGGTTTGTATLHVNAVNDQATLDPQNLVTRDDDTAVTGSARGSDVDGDKLTYSLVDGEGNKVSSLETTYGKVTINTETGEYTFTPNDKADAIADGKSEHDSFRVVANDGTVDSDVSTVDVTVTGSNDGPRTELVELTGGDEDHSVTFTAAQLLGKASDIDGDTLSVSNLSATNGTIHQNDDGSYTFTPNADFNGDVNITYTVDDGHGGTTQGTATLDVTAVNDAAEIGGELSGGVSEDGATRFATGTVTVSDVDTGEAHVQAFSQTTDEGTFSIGTDGKWSFELNNGNADIQGLAEGETLTKTFKVTSADGTDTQEVSVTITGSNDGPVVSGAIDLGDTAEDNSVTFTAAQLLGKASDIDGDTLSVSNLSATNGTIHQNDDGSYTFTPNADFNGDVNITYTVDDGHGGTTQGTATLDVTAVNDAAEIGGELSGGVSEDGATRFATGTVTVSDVDTGEAHVQAFSQTTDEGTFSIGMDGKWSFELNNGNADIQNLAEGETLTKEFKVHSADGTEQTVSVTIGGSNDAAVISGDASKSVGEDTASVSGKLNVSDADHDQSTFQATSQTVGEGTFTMGADGQWTFAVNHDAVQGLAEGETLTKEFKVHSADGTEQTVSVTIGGSNDAAVISGDASKSVGEDTASVSGKLNVSDADHDQSTFQATSQTVGEGTFTMGADGNWTFAVNNAAVQNLAEGETLTKEFKVHSADGTEQTVSVTIGGRNDAAVIFGRRLQVGGRGHRVGVGQAERLRRRSRPVHLPGHQPDGG
ncbi:hypothetical protein WV31_20020 [Magnetospirillum sp. ME-1]|uniref:VCBS domain-containing protein n=1 Tax=Magnetospirillum sp. ME-1 TaxID=1639348 RepID=UPI000A17C11C|nr:VCBS domain-containing protein [Magnetospirillum sp. ME-1]ARJ67779.1 hypothetical protein WV31_20020 [Magnetospirillum sp. ME-1]